MEQKTRRDTSFLSIVSDFEYNFEKGKSVVYAAPTFLELIRYYEEELQFEKAIEVADAALEIFAYNPDFYIIKARLFFQNNQHEEALELLSKAEKISPYEHDILLLKIRILAFQGQDSQARELLEDMKKYVSASDLSDVYLSESYINEAQQDYNGMYENLAKAIISDVHNDEALERIGFATQLTKNYAQSIVFHQTILDENPFSYLAWYNLGHAQAAEGEYVKAIDAIEYSFIIETNFENGYLDCADICIQEKEYERALKIYETYMENFGLNEEVLMNMAECRFQLNDLNKSKILLNKLLKLDPYNDEVYYKLGLCYSKAEKWNKAINAFHKAITLEDNCEDYYLAIAQAHNAVGSYKNAEYFYGKAVEMGPEQSIYWRDYISFLIKIGKKDEALFVFEEADDFTFGADLLYCKAVAQFLTDKKVEAFATFQEALTEDYDQHTLIFEIEPELVLNKEIQAMINYYKEE